jgi:hypothetical protein
MKMMDNFNKEYVAIRRKAYKAHTEVKNALQKFAKRSKYIEYDCGRSYWGWCSIHVTILKDGKVAKEMLDYIKSICPYTTDGSTFRSYEGDLGGGDDIFSDWEIKFDICVYRK